MSYLETKSQINWPVVLPLKSLLNQTCPPSITSYKYENGNNNVSVEHYKIIDGGHVWFSNDFNGKNTGQLIWDFVSKYDIDGLIE